MKILSVLGSVILVTLFCCQNKQDKPSSREVSKIDSINFEILATEHYPTTENFHILLGSYKGSKDSLQWFIDSFRSEYCTKQCNIYIYDDVSIKKLTTKYPLTDFEYLKVADHFIASSMFEIPEVWGYPFQDIKYKELGGKNWKKIE